MLIAKPKLLPIQSLLHIAYPLLTAYCSIQNGTRNINCMLRPGSGTFSRR